MFDITLLAQAEASFKVRARIWMQGLKYRPTQAQADELQNYLIQMMREELLVIDVNERLCFHFRADFVQLEITDMCWSVAPASTPIKMDCPKADDCPFAESFMLED